MMSIWGKGRTLYEYTIHYERKNSAVLFSVVAQWWVAIPSVTVGEQLVGKVDSVQHYSHHTDDTHLFSQLPGGHAVCNMHIKLFCGHYIGRPVLADISS